MSFTVEIVFTGVGVVQIRTKEKRSPSPTAVEFLPLRPPKMMGAGAHGAEHGEADHPLHVPRMSYCLSDLVRPDAAPFAFQPAPDGLCIVQKSIDNQQVQIEVDGGEPTAFNLQWAASPKLPPTGDDVRALDWIPDLESHLHVDDAVTSSSATAALVFASRVVLPPGRLEARHLLLAEDGTPRPCHFVSGGSMTDPMVVAEEVVWRRTGVQALRVAVDWPPLEFDGKFREQRGEEPLVRLAITSLPEMGFSGRFNMPSHLSMFSRVSASGKEPWGIEPVTFPGSGICSHAVCPPTKREIVDD
jgi:hypothetical protein